MSTNNHYISLPDTRAIKDNRSEIAPKMCAFERCLPSSPPGPAGVGWAGLALTVPPCCGGSGLGTIRGIRAGGVGQEHLQTWAGPWQVWGASVVAAPRPRGFKLGSKKLRLELGDLQGASVQTLL